MYRRTLDEMPAGREEVEEAEEEGIKFMYLAAPVEFSGDGKVKSVKLIRMKVSRTNPAGADRSLWRVLSSK